MSAWKNQLPLYLAGCALCLVFGFLPNLLRWDAHRVNTLPGQGKFTLHGRTLLAEYCFRRAGDYFHSGALPSMFDSLSPEEEEFLKKTEKFTVPSEHWVNQSPRHGPPRDWLDRFGRNFFPTRHTHLNDGGSVAHGENQVREIMPWLWFAAELNPNHLESYLEAAFWLRRTEGRSREAESFLWQGFRANRDSYELLFELGRLSEEEHGNITRAQNLWEGALDRWEKRNRGAKEPDGFALRQIASRLALQQEKLGNFTQAITYLTRAKECSKHTESLDRWIGDLHQKQGVKNAPVRTE